MKYDIQEILSNAFSYEKYMQEMQLFAKLGKTSGPNQSESMVAYTKLNFTRMKRLNKTSMPGHRIMEQLKTLPFHTTWVMITEAWCGDAAQNIPFIFKVADLAGEKVDFNLIYRDQNIAYMDDFLTNGGRSIPKLIVYRTSGMEVLTTWGPRPKPVQEIVLAYKNTISDKIPLHAFLEEIQRWYNADKNNSLENELFHTFQEVIESQINKTV
ncbi:MAG TPA: thioredoxin family protein [Cryomorphaceae bacterium]|nr:thioredoxin family protein [Cryomorphaceae bacterium]